MTRQALRHRATLAASALLLLGCSSETPAPAVQASGTDYTPLVVRDSSMNASLVVPAVAAPWQRATLSTKLMASVTRVAAQVGDRVTAGTPLVTMDVRDVDARATQAGAGLTAAEASRAEAQLAVDRLRALVKEEAAPRAQLDAAEASLARAEGAVRAARGGTAELAAARSYGQLRAPFAGIVVARHVDPGDFASPGAPLLTLVDDHALRLTASVAPATAARVRAGQRLMVEIEGVQAPAEIKGVAPAPAGGTYTITARVENATRSLATGGAASLHLAAGEQRALLVPAAALVRDGELVGVHVPSATGVEQRWLRVGRTHGAHVEVLGGLRHGDTILVPRTAGPR